MKQSVSDSRKVLETPEISIWIDKYDDVFSDFDSRPFGERSLSDDFLREVRKMVNEKSTDAIQLKFNILDDQRSLESEAIIIDNLNTYFKNIALALNAERRETLRKGYTLLAAGFFLMVFIVYLSSINTKGPFLNGFYLMLEPVGWFMTWTGLDQVFQNTRKNETALNYNAKMAQAAIVFSSFDAAQEAAAGPKQKTVIPFDSSNLRVA